MGPGHLHTPVKGHKQPVSVMPPVKPDTGCLVPQSFRIEDEDDKQGTLIPGSLTRGRTLALVSPVIYD